MYYANFYAEKSKRNIEADIKKKGFIPHLISNPPNFEYSSHSHPESKLLVIIHGGMKVVVGSKNFECKEGDMMLIKGEVEHSAIVGEKGCEFYWSERS